MNVLSLFDGISCGQIALNRAGIKCDKYYASEIDKYAIKVTQKNYPNTIQIGSVTDVDVNVLPKIDLLFGGSPCNDFSFSGKRKGMSTKDEIEITTLEKYLELKEKGFEFEGQSYLFWEYVRILRDIKNINPNVKFLLENVMMVDKWKNVITRTLGVQFIEINSSLLSAQNRRRLYWTNISGIIKPKDKGIVLKDIIESGEVDRDKSYCIDANYFKGGSLKNYLEKKRRQLVLSQSENRLMVKCGAIRGRNPDNPKSREAGLPTEQMLELREDDKTNCLTTVTKDNVLCRQVGKADLNGHDSIKRVYATDGKSPCLNANANGGGNLEPKITQDYEHWRKLTPIECERLQTIPPGYTECISNSQRYRCLGNGWTVDVIAHILSFIDNEPKKEYKLF